MTPSTAEALIVPFKENQ